MHGLETDRFELIDRVDHAHLNQLREMQLDGGAVVGQVVNAFDLLAGRLDFPVRLAQADAIGSAFSENVFTSC